MTGVQVGVEVAILLQLVDGATDQYPQAQVRDDEANLLATLNLSHQADGVYAPAAPYSMPDEIFIEVSYIVYSDAGHSAENTLYERRLDIFYRIVPGDYQADLTFLEAVEGGRWHIVGNQMIFYEADNVTEAMRFNLFDAAGNPTMTNVMERVRV